MHDVSTLWFSVLYSLYSHTASEIWGPEFSKNSRIEGITNHSSLLIHSILTTEVTTSHLNIVTIPYKVLCTRHVIYHFWIHNDINSKRYVYVLYTIFRLEYYLLYSNCFSIFNNHEYSCNLIWMYSYGQHIPECLM